MALLRSVVPAKLVLKHSSLAFGKMTLKLVSDSIVPVILRLQSDVDARQIRQWFAGLCDDSALPFKAWSCKGMRARPFAWCRSRSGSLSACPHLARRSRLCVMLQCSTPQSASDAQRSSSQDDRPRFGTTSHAQLVMSRPFEISTLDLEHRQSDNASQLASALPESLVS
eukprot:15261115-Heterocapsa_arctica.AAC.1